MSNSCPLSFIEMKAVRQRALVKVSIVVCKKEEKEKGKEGASSSIPKVVGKGMPKRKAEGKDDRLLKKGTVTSGNK